MRRGPVYAGLLLFMLSVGTMRRTIIHHNAMNTLSTWFSRLFEPAAWSGGLVYLSLVDPAAPGPSFCLLKNVGFEYCPGCGLGTSIAWALQGDFLASFEAHPLGIVALIALSARIITLTHPLLSSLFSTHKKGYTHA